ncbi:PAS domain S-box protein [Algoriphagus sp. NG3]|uniref:PAS domain S-box protein n=1 Tax=Algoriphagus sp. NG3 TaxID=3097546 RepID=UPI002A819F06|nr:PAS domain S-box protein [Algoriphagus sp. NG3]WPR76645.1 PAS domain S-box protein [Algoriphagus sp. NG3]
MSGFVWIFFSDLLLVTVFSDDIREMSRFQILKGCLYVMFSGLLLYYLIKKLYDQVNGGKQELELLFTNPNLGIFKVDVEGNFIYVSSNILQITGFSDIEIIGKNVIDLTPTKYLKKDQQLLDNIRDKYTEGGFILKKHLQDKQGNQIIVKVYGIALKDKKGIKKGYLAAFQNITEQEEYMKSLKAKNKQLQELSSDQSHLVRAPLARILGIIELIQNIDLEPSEKEELINHLKSSGEELDDALKDLSQKMNS